MSHYFLCLSYASLQMHWSKLPKTGVSNSFSLNVILGLYKCNYSLTVKELKLHWALWRQPWGWYGPQWKWFWHPSLKNIYYFPGYYALEFVPFLTLGTLFCLIPPLQLLCWNPVPSLLSVKLPSLPWILSSLNQTWVISVAVCTTLFDFNLGYAFYIPPS